VVLLDTPFHLTRNDLAEWISETWRCGGCRRCDNRDRALAVGLTTYVTATLPR